MEELTLDIAGPVTIWRRVIGTSTLKNRHGIDLSSRNVNQFIRELQSPTVQIPLNLDEFNLV